MYFREFSVTVRPAWALYLVEPLCEGRIDLNSWNRESAKFGVTLKVSEERGRFGR